MAHAAADGRAAAAALPRGRAGRRACSSVPGVAIEIVDEDLVSIQRAHWFDHAVELDDAAGLAAVLDSRPSRGRACACSARGCTRCATRCCSTARVTRPAITRLRASLRVRRSRPPSEALALPPLDEFADSPSPDPAGARREPAAPARAAHADDRRHRAAAAVPASSTAGSTRRPPALLLDGLPDGPECVPVIANLTTGDALIYRGTIGPGQRLWIAPGRRRHGDTRGSSAPTSPTACVSVRGLVPGTPWPSVQSAARRRSRCGQGRTSCGSCRSPTSTTSASTASCSRWPTWTCAKGAATTPTFDQSLFYQDPAASLHAVWMEAAAGGVRDRAAGRHAAPSRRRPEADALAARSQLGASLSSRSTACAPPACAPRCVLRELHETQRTGDALVSILPLVRREIGPTAPTRLPDAGGVFGVTDFDDSTFR